MFISTFEFSISSSFFTKLEYYGKEKSSVGILPLELDYHCIHDGYFSTNKCKDNETEEMQRCSP